jgi:hypothetical protein
MSETAPQQQAPREDMKYVDTLHDTIANYDLGQDVWGKEVVDPIPGRVDDIDKAHEMALAAKPGIDKALGVVALRDHDISPIGAEVRNAEGKRIGYLPATRDASAHLVTVPHRTELVDDKGVKTGKTGVRSEEYSYKDLNSSIQSANRDAMYAGQAYERRNK